MYVYSNVMLSVILYNYVVIVLFRIMYLIEVLIFLYIIFYFFFICGLNFWGRMGVVRSRVRFVGLGFLCT